VSECPVCGKGGVDQAAQHCPQCHADLECFALLERLQEAGPVAPAGTPEQQAPAGPHGSGGWVWRWGVHALGFLLLLAVFVLQLMALWQPRPEPAAVDGVWNADVTTAALRAMVGKIDRLSGRLETLEAQLRDLGNSQARGLELTTALGGQLAQVVSRVDGSGDALAPAASVPSAQSAQSPPGEAVTTATGRALAPHHHLSPGETLWSIAQRYYGQGWLYPVLIAQNPGLAIYHEGSGVLRLFADPAQAQALYREITPPGGEGRLFRYQVQAGDDWYRLAERFLGRAQRAPELLALNPGSELTPGRRILIPLQ
jgi:hypothetical protein